MPSTPIFRKLLLNPPPEEELIDLAYRESLVDFSHLLGEQGVTTTNLMPTGKAEINGQLIDVISDGLPVDRGAAVIVVNTRGNRVQVPHPRRVNLAFVMGGWGRGWPSPQNVRRSVVSANSTPAIHVSVFGLLMQAFRP